MARIHFILFSAVLLSCFALFSAQTPNPTPCLYSAASSKILQPLQLLSNKCPTNTSYCMNVIYAYSNFQYNGPSTLKPNKGEIVMFLAKYPDATGSYHLVTMLNANVSTTMNVTLSLTGTNPAKIELYDDPITSTDTWQWDSATNSGHFTWITLPTYTDGCIIGPITFVDNYCVKAIFNQPNNAIQTLSVMSGNSTNPSRIWTVPYTSGTTFEFCQYPQTAIVKKDVTCPGASNGNASVSIVNGPSGVAYRWYNAAGTVIGNTNSLTNVPAGNYTVFVNDTTITGCDATRRVVITEPTLYPASVAVTPFACSTKGSAVATPVGGSGGFSYQWIQGSTVIGTGSSIGNLNVGTYSLKVTDSCGSIATTVFSVGTTGCCGDGICQANEACGGASFCAADCGTCCAPGFYTSNGNCVVCPAGTYGDSYGATSCNTCPANTYNAGGDDACAYCPDNTYSAAGSGVCSNCPVGKVRNQDSTTCVTCGAGMIPTCGSSSCEACPAGTYAVDGWTACQDCAAGTFSAAGASSCITCAAGSYADAGSDSCTACPVGTSPAGSSHELACQ